MDELLDSRRYEEYDICYQDKITGKVYIMPPNPKHGFNCGYSIFIPEGCQLDTTLLVHCCNTGGGSVVDGKLDKSKSAIWLYEGNMAAKLSTIELNPGMWYGYDLKMPVLIPLIPRVRGYYTQALGSRVFNNDVSYLEEDNKNRSGDKQISQSEIMQIQEQCRDLPSQLVSIILDSKILLEKLGIKVDNKVIIEGYSAGSKFANGFTSLHPEMVKACICGGNSGLSILPVADLDNQELKFPLGVADIPNFDFDLFKNIPQYYYIGKEDDNDPAMAVTDSDGCLHPRWEENYTLKEIYQIHTLLGKNIQERFDNNQRIYESFGVNAKFERFNGNHKTVTGQKDKDGNYIVNESIKNFIRKVLNDEKEKEDPKEMGYTKTLMLELVSIIGIIIIVLGIIFLR